MDDLFPVFFILCLFGCGSSKPTAAADPAFVKVESIVAANCGRCHNGSKEPAFDATNFKSSSAAQRLKAGTMPPDRTIPDADKKALLDYLTAS